MCRHAFLYYTHTCEMMRSVFAAASSLCVEAPLPFMLGKGARAGVQSNVAGMVKAESGCTYTTFLAKAYSTPTPGVRPHPIAKNPY